jgi:hypothetical protein
MQLLTNLSVMPISQADQWLPERRKQDDVPLGAVPRISLFSTSVRATCL